jgi:AmmeMemoRadiSam system protein B/AmmeMemoRadiSam system protein A
MVQNTRRLISAGVPGRRRILAPAAGAILLLVGGTASWSWAAPVGGLVLGEEDEPRTPKVAGKFYPDDQVELHDLVNEFLDRQPDPAITKKPRILVVPHAGYDYSGLVAASGYRHLVGHAYDGVVVVGFTHRAQFDGSSVDTRSAYQTPLGLLPVDREAAAVLLTHPGLVHLEEAHELEEHSLEVQLPFLQVALSRVRVVPVLMGNASLEDAGRLAGAFAHLARLGDYLFVFTTDLSHYHPYSEAEHLDEGTVNAILFETPQAVYRLFQRAELEACGRGPIVASLLLAAKLGYPKPEILSYANSGETAGNPSSVVGYAAIGMFDRSPEPATQTLSRESGQALVVAARQTLERALAKREPAREVRLERYAELSRANGLFVTLRKHGRLRGCIGRIETNEPLSSTIRAVALDAALRDSRFEPVKPEELDDLQVEVSVLTPPRKLAQPKDLVAGRDGVILEHEGHSGVFLPQVWEETGWARIEFLQELASQKAGLPPDAWQRANLSVFQDQVFVEESLITADQHADSR